MHLKDLVQPSVCALWLVLAIVLDREVFKDNFATSYRSLCCGTSKNDFDEVVFLSIHSIGFFREK